MSDAQETLKLTEIEELVNMKAQEMAKGMRQGTGLKFRIWLAPGETPMVKMERGTTVNIYISGASIKSKDFWDMVRTSLRQVHKLQDVADLAIVDHVFVKRQTEKKWSRLTYKNDKSEVFPILHSSRLVIESKLTVTVKDRLTGETYEVTAAYPQCDSNRMTNNAIAELSRQVMLREAAEEAANNTETEQVENG